MTTYRDLRNNQEQDFAGLLTQLQEQQKTGTLKLRSGERRLQCTKYVYLKRGTVELLKATRSRTLLGKALLKRHKLTQEQLDAALERQRAASNSLRLGEILVGMGIVKESDVHQALAYQIAEEIFELFTWDEIEGEFVRGEPPQDIFEREDLQARVSLSPVQLARQAIKRQNELADIGRTLPSKQDVYAPTPRAYRSENEQAPAINEVLTCLDGQRNVEELLDVVRAPDLVALRVLARMVHEGDAAPLSAAELLGLGQALEERGEFERARDRYLRVEDLAYPDFDLPRRIGQIAEALGDVPEACRRYFVYADRCDQSGYPDVAMATLERVLELDPEQRRARERFAELLTKSARALGDGEGRALAEQAVLQYERVLQDTPDAEDRRRILVELQSLLPEREDLKERLVHVSIEVGDTAQAVLELQDLAANALIEQDLGRAVELLEKIVELDPDDIMALQSLGDTYAKLGRTEEAVGQYLSFAKSLEASGLAAASADTLVDIYEKVVELDPENTSARRYLAIAYEGKENAQKAISNYSRMVEGLRKQDGAEAELLGALERLSELKPADLGVALERARLAKQLGRGAESLSIFRTVAATAQVQGDDQKAMAALKELLNESPGDLDGHLALAKLQAQSGQDAEAGRRCGAVFELAVIAERYELAYEAVKHALDAQPDEPRHRERLARIQVQRGRNDEAARTLVRAARRARDDEDLGVCRQWARRALELDATCDDARDLLESLRRARVSSEFPEGQAAEPLRETVQATITGGGGAPSIQGMTSKSKRVGNIADRLRNMKLGPEAPRTSSSETQKLSRKANSAMSRLRALRGGDGDGDSDESGPAAGVDGAASGGGERAISKGPEAPGEAADAVVSQKSKSSLSKLRQLRAGGSSAEQSGPPALEAAGGGGPAISKGPEAPGEAADASVSQKSRSSLSKLRQLRAGGSSAEQSAPLEAAGGGGGPAISKGPEAPGEAADASVSQKSKSSLSKLRQLRAGGGAAPEPAAAPDAAGEGGGGGPAISKGPEAPGAAADPGVSKKSKSSLSKLRALRGGGAPEMDAAPAQPSETPPTAQQTAASTSAAPSSAMERLRALRGGGGAATPSVAPAPGPGPGAVSKGPEAPGEAADAEVSEKASSALDRLRALRGGGGSAPAPAPGAASQVSPGPEAPGQAAGAAVTEKASSALSRLRALRSGGGAAASGAAAAPAAAAPAAAAPGAVSKGPEAPGEAADQQVSKKASSAMSRLRSLKAGGQG
ncbi:MAG: tetratricopeptide repeat protein [Planctomycetota bacterium]